MNLARLDLNLLVVLDALLAERHVTRAAKRVGLSQPAMSHALARLRAELGDAILVRTAQGMRPTARAAAMTVPLARALEELGRVLDPPERFEPQRAVRRFVIATSDYVELVLLPRLCARIWQEAPGVDLRVVNLVGGVADDLSEARVDLTITLADDAREGASFRGQRLFDDDFVCVVREDHPVARRRLSIDDFIVLNHALVAPRGDSEGGMVDRILARLGKKRRIALEVPHFLVAPHVVRETDLVLTLASRVAKTLSPMLGLRQLAPPVEIERFAMTMQWHERSHADPAHVWFRRTVRAVARSL